MLVDMIKVESVSEGVYVQVAAVSMMSRAQWFLISLPIVADYNNSSLTS